MVKCTQKKRQWTFAERDSLSVDIVLVIKYRIRKIKLVLLPQTSLKIQGIFNANVSCFLPITPMVTLVGKYYLEYI